MGLGTAAIAGGTTGYVGNPPGADRAGTADRPTPAPAVDSRTAAEEAGDPHLRSAREVTGYTIVARDGEVGGLDDLLLAVEPPDWRVRWLVVDTGAYLASHPVVIAPDWVRDVDWAEARAFVTVAKDKVAGAPAYDPQKLFSREQEQQTYAWHGLRPYW